MNEVLQLRGRFEQRKNRNGGGPVKLPQGAFINVEHLIELKKQLNNVLKYWQNRQSIIGGALVSVHYIRVVPKSNRLKVLLAEGSKNPNEFIRGAKFTEGPELDNGQPRKKHVFVYFVSTKVIDDSIKKLSLAIDIVKEEFNGCINFEDVMKINKDKKKFSKLARTNFLQIICDTYFVEKFDVDTSEKKITNESIVTIYKTGIGTKILLEKFGIDMVNAKMLNDTTLLLTPDEIERLQDQAPYLIAMEVTDWTDISKEDIKDKKEITSQVSIPEPHNEPIIGVIDTHFDKRVYFSKWVKYKNMLDKSIELEAKDFDHGTAVSSIIVDGPTINPNLNDGCGRFRVRHFGVSKANGFHSFSILKTIRAIIAANKYIKVWNLSLGSDSEINSNFISPEASELDEIQNEYDVIFIIAGTNKKVKEKKHIGAPADSLNSIVVNSVNLQGSAASYTRVGPVLSFFHKPDLSYYGGDIQQQVKVCEPLGEASVCGTSYAAPWITRKMAYLIYIMGLTRECAKALIIDSAAGWQRKDDYSCSIGYGIVPIRIEDIITVPNDEIKFLLTGSIEEYETFTYSIPVPKKNELYPYFAKATLVYFPQSDRNQGVDYTSTEMDIHFGRVIEKDNKISIKSIDNNTQGDDGGQKIFEESARELYRKWDNVKHINDTIREKSRPRKAYDKGMWGLSVKTKERTVAKAGKGLKFGVVVTLKEMYGVNRIDEFIKSCKFNEWIVTKLKIDNQVNIYNKAEEDIQLE